MKTIIWVFRLQTFGPQVKREWTNQSDSRESVGLFAWNFGISNNYWGFLYLAQKDSLYYYSRNKKVLLRERKRHTACKRAQDADPPLAGPNPPPAGPDPPQLDWPPRLDLTHPPPGPDPPRLDLTHPPRLDLTPPGWTWPPPQLDWSPPAGPDPTPPGTWTWPPPRCEQSENITFPILRMRAVTMSTQIDLMSDTEGDDGTINIFHHS